MGRIVALVAVLASMLTASGGRAADPGETPPPDPAPNTLDWMIRDAENQRHATERLDDEYANPAFAATFWTQTPETFFTNVRRQGEHPGRPIVTAAQLVPGGTTADPYRTTWEEQGRGVRYEFAFLNRYGARLRASLWAPNPGAPDPVTGEPMNAPYPAVVITTGSIQGYQNLYLWAAQGLAEAGYVVLTFDVQGQGESETFGHDSAGNTWCAPTSSEPIPPGAPWENHEQNPSCPGVPFQQPSNFVKGTVDALDFLFSSDDDPYRWWRPGTATLKANPLASIIDVSRVGLAGHSLGASAISLVQGHDMRVDAIVAWDNLSAASGVVPRVPAMGQNADYFFNVAPTFAPPAHKDGAFLAWRDAGVDAMQVALLGSTHLEWTFVPYILPASRKGERVAMHYTLAWFDRYLKGPVDAAQNADATRRLTLQIFDTSADDGAIGAGAWDVAAGNVPHRIAGERVWTHLSVYSPSNYWLDGGSLACDDLRRNAAC